MWDAARGLSIEEAIRNSVDWKEGKGWGVFNTHKGEDVLSYDAIQWIRFGHNIYNKFESELP
jgi:hypothetical protein